MNVLLVHLNPAGLTFQLGLAYIAAILEAKKHNLSLLFLSKLDKKQIDYEIQRIKTEIVLISVASDSFELCKQLVAYLNNKKAGILILLGGIHPTLNPEECIQLGGVLGVCIGEGEYPVSELLEVLERGDNYTHIQNIWLRNNGKVYRNELRPLIQNLDELSMPNYEIFRKYYKNFKILPVILSRGCPFNCSYCCNHVLRRLYQGKGSYLRHHSITYSLNLITQLVKQFPEVESIEFFDDTFISNKDWLRNFLKDFSRLGLSYICNCRFDILDEELVELLANSGCIKINAAVECGNEEIRRNVLRRPMHNEDIIERAKLLKKYKIALFTHNMVGVPYETEDDILKTIELNRIIRPDAMQVSIFNPYPNSDLTNLCIQQHWMNKELSTTSFHDFTVLKTPYIKPHIVDYYLIAFESMVYGTGFNLYVKKILYWFLHFHHNWAYLFLRRLKSKEIFTRLIKATAEIFS